MKPNAFRIAVMPGEGIGVEVMEAALAVLDAVEARFGLAFTPDRIPGGAHHYRDTGAILPPDGMARAGQADAILFGAMGWPDIRYPDGTEIAPQLDLRFAFGLYAGVRPIRAIPGVPRGARRSARRARSTSSSCANRPRACSPRAARAR